MLKAQTYERLLSNASDFQEWLSDKQAEIVGYIGSKERCPLANWLFERTHQEYQVSRNYYGVEGNSNALPSWAWFFVQVIEIEPEGVIYGKDALEILESVLESKREPAWNL
jgi:hypothetical protein